MAYPNTDTGYNMFDMLSMLQKSIRRGDYENAGFAAYQLKNTFRAAMWNRLLVISAEDCFGVLTKEIVELKRQDNISNNNKLISNAVALMCRSKKSRDACYFACNFVLTSRKPRIIKTEDEMVKELYSRIKNSDTDGNNDSEYDSFGFSQMSIFQYGCGAIDNEPVVPEGENIKAYAGAALQIALKHRDMDMIGYEVDVLRREDRNFLWDVYIDYADETVADEIIALRKADDIVNSRKKDLEKDEIFISKAAMILCHNEDSAFKTVMSGEIVRHNVNIDWNTIRVKPIEECILKDGEIPEWVYDCHTLKGKKMGKTDWDMTTTEQLALFPLQKAYFDDASWFYTYEDDYKNKHATYEQMIPIWTYARNHQANPVEYIPYED